MATASIGGAVLRGVSTCVPSQVVDNERDTREFDAQEVKKVVSLAGVKQRRVADSATCASDLCRKAAQDLMAELGWTPESIGALIFVTQSADYLLPSTSCLLHRDLNLPDSCAVFDVGLGCSGYPYGLWMASMMLQTSNIERVLVLHGETASKFTYPEDRATVLLFGDAGSATALEKGEGKPWAYSLHSDGKGYSDLIIPAGGYRQRKTDVERDYYVHMNGTNLFNFTVQRVPVLINDTLRLLNMTHTDVDAFIFHQSNQFIMRHIAKKCELPAEKTPVFLKEYGNTGGPSVPLALTLHYRERTRARTEWAMLLGYGVGLSWGSALLEILPETRFLHSDY